MIVDIAIGFCIGEKTFYTNIEAETYNTIKPTKNQARILFRINVTSRETIGIASKLLLKLAIDEFSARAENLNT